MLRELIGWILKNYLGKYVENINTAQLSIALLSGEVELENLPLKKDALSHFGLPIRAISGSIGKIKLQVPVRQFRTAPWCINIEKVYIICAPVNFDEWNCHEEELSDLHYKQAFLDNLEAKWRTQKEESSYYSNSYTGWMNYGTSLIGNIVENLQLKITDVHIRYEDIVTIPNRHFCCGLTIESLTAQSCDSNWIPGFASWTQNQSTFKLVELNLFSLYVEKLEESFSSLESNELAKAMEKLKVKTDHEFIIKPVSAQAKLKKDRSEAPLRTRTRPRLICDLIWNEVSLSLNENQYSSLVNCMRGLDDISKFKKYRLLRPKMSVQENPKAWWFYAARSNGLLRYDKYHNVAKNNLRYLSICKKLILNPNETLSTVDKDFKDSIEKERNIEELRQLRETCMYLIPEAEEVNSNDGNQGRSMLLHWFPQWWGWYGNNNRNLNTTTASIPIIEAQSSIEDEFLNALNDTVESNSNSILKRDAVFGKFVLILNKGTLDVCNGGFSDPLVSMIQFQFENLLLNFESRPRSGSHFVSLSLGSVLLKDHITPDTQFPDIIKPQIKEEQQQKAKVQRNRLSLNLMSTPIPKMPEIQEPLFQVEYEKKPFSHNTDYRLLIKSRSLDIVYNIEVINWLIEFLSKPNQLSARLKIEAMKQKTKMGIKKNWDHIIEGRLSERKTWTLEIDISAPQIIFVENFTDRLGSSLVVIDFGRLQLSNTSSSSKDVPKDEKLKTMDSDTSTKDSEDDEMFMTPCSTPPGSEVTSTTDSPTLVSALSDSVIAMDNGQDSTRHDDLQMNEIDIHNKLYDCYNILLTDLQLLVCRGKERWSFATTRSTSNLHVLDRFNISLQVERRIMNTNDPQYPSLTLSGTLPKLNVHVNETKISTMLNMLNIISNNNIETTFKLDDDAQQIENEKKNESLCPEISEGSKLILLQFTIDQMSLEVQSSGRSIVELQVTGVKTGLSQRQADTCITLSVHGLLLVDAMQSYGPDFELLVASHRHVGMDSLSGSLRQSEPCSPCSPGSPDPNNSNIRPMSPLSISKAISSLQKVNSHPTWHAAMDGDIDALITIEVILIEPGLDGEKLHIANIQFNNLDIIANQETVVELLGFIKRIYPTCTTKANVSKNDFSENKKTNEAVIEKLRTEITFDFHRLNILILRAVMRDNFPVARKVGTFTMSEARIHAHTSLENVVKVEGSLGGLQVLDLTPEGINHQRILSVGNDPLTDPPREPIDLLTSLSNEVYGIKKQIEERQALSFKITRNMNACVDIKIRMASVWFIHCARFMQELNWCATEFKHYLKNLAKSIREKATDMALNLVQPRFSDITRTTNDFPNSPHHARRHRTISLTKVQENLLLPTAKVKIQLDILLSSPVLVVPRSNISSQVLVAHLGKISISNYKEMSKNEIIITSRTDSFQEYYSDENIFEFDDVKVTDDECNCDIYSIEVRDMNVFSLDTTSRKGFRLSALPRAEEFYSCNEDAIAILHDTEIRLEVCRKLESSPSNLASNSTSFISISETNEQIDQLIVSGCIINPLRLTMKRQQYEQVLETIDNVFKVPQDLTCPATDVKKTRAPLIDEDTQLETDDYFAFDKHQQKKKSIYQQGSVEQVKQDMQPKVMFSLPIFTIQLTNNENIPLVEISFRDFNVNYDKLNQHETQLQVSLRSVIMEDLLETIDSKNRIMVSSSNDEEIKQHTSFLSNSCPNLVGIASSHHLMSTSLPDNLQQNQNEFQQLMNRQNKHFKGAGLLNLSSNCPGTPPPSPQPCSSSLNEDNLVIYTSLMVDPRSPIFENKYKSRRQRGSIDFNCLSLNVSVKSWFVLLNFFGFLSDEQQIRKSSNPVMNPEIKSHEGNSELDITVKSLTLVLVRPDYELAKANVSNARFIVSKVDECKNVEGSFGSISLCDLTGHGEIYREKFITSGNEALSFSYVRDQLPPDVIGSKRSLKKDSNLKIKMSSVRYVHTKRFVMEIQNFFKDFQKLQMPVMRKKHYLKPAQMGLEIHAESPLILLPLSSRSEKLIIVNLGELSLKNEFRMSNDRETISVRKDKYGNIELLDVILLELLHIDLVTGYRSQINDGNRLDSYSENDQCLDMGNYYVYKNGPSLLKDKCHLQIQIERNLDSWRSHNVPDISVHLKLSKLDIILDLAQYKLIRGFLSYNMGEEINDIYQSSDQINTCDSNINLNQQQPNDVWNNLSITLYLQDVSVVLKQMDQTSKQFKKTESFACVNFIKSTLSVDSFSDASQDIDLVSQEILITDTRSVKSQHNEENVFKNILQPITAIGHSSIVQAEIHSRKRHDNTKFTILLNNMRVMAILDWLEFARDYIVQVEESPVATKTYLLKNQKESADASVGSFELKLNITDSELVFVENTNQLETNAIILKSTTVLSYRPNEVNKVMSINLNNLEVFSCVLNSEEDTALSIIDPVTINMEVRKGTLVMHMQKQFLIRLSYHDVKMIQKMLQSLPSQTRLARNKRLNNDFLMIDDGKNLNKLKSLGFKTEDCKLALELSDNELDEAALWLTQNSEPIKCSQNMSTMPEDRLLKINTIEIKASRITLCVIDDCKDADVPLLDLSLTHLEMSHDVDFNDTCQGKMKAIFCSDYFNRALSGWEPIIESWRFDATWSFCLTQLPKHQSRLNLKINSNDVLKLNITGTLMELFEMVRNNWTEDYYESDANTVSILRRRSPFVPFAIKNETGMSIKFTTIVAAADNALSNVDLKTREWNTLDDGATTCFSFSQTNTKQRHLDSHKSKSNLHQIGVCVQGYTEVKPITVDKVGVYFRHAGPETVDTYSMLPKARIVFAVTLEGSAQKLIIVRSALKFHNKLDHPVLVKMEHLFGHLNIRSWPHPKTVIVASNENYSVPLSHVHAFIYVKPLPVNLRFEDFQQITNMPTENTQEKLKSMEYWKHFGRYNDNGSMNNYQFTEKSVHWKDVTEHLESHQEIRSCSSVGNKLYNILFQIRKEPYPTKEHFNVILPGHTITLRPPLRLHNLLPTDLLFRLPSGVQGRVSSSNTASIHEIDITNTVELTVSLDNFSNNGTVIFINSGNGTTDMDVKLKDTNGRVLILRAHIQTMKGNGMQISFSTQFWLINRTGLPLIFRQEGVSHEFAGQFSENEQARLVSPLMFSFSDPECSMALTIRLGKRFGTNLSWSQPFSLHKDVTHRHLKSNTTNETFVIGIEVRRGKGRFSYTHVVTFNPRFQLYNRSSYKLQFSQKCFATILTDAIAKATFVEAVSQCHLAFHWPRLDKPQELCVRLPEVPDCLWSSGIPIHETQSLYINVRDMNGNMHFLRLEIILQGATYYMLFGNAEVLPPPIRIDNYSEVVIKFYQNNCQNQIKSSVKPHSSVAYVMDEILGSNSLCIESPGGDTFKCPLYGFESGRLTYENFIYITFTQTFENVTTFNDNDEFDVKSQQLVLGVIGNRIVLTKKQAGDRSQLWRMNMEKQLEHEGSSPPTEPGKKSLRFVLDLERPPQPLQQIPLVLRPANNQRKSTQTWYFTEGNLMISSYLDNLFYLLQLDGRLMCEHLSMCVQPRNGFFGLRSGSEAVLGLIVRDTKLLNSVGVPFEQAIAAQKLRPGSGCLSLNFRMDGPIKTIKIRDIKHHSEQDLLVDPRWRHVSHILSNGGTPTEILSKSDRSIDEYHINLVLTKGIGMSLVSKRPFCEELAYISFENIQMEIINTHIIKSIDLSVRDLQIDNQTFESPCPIFLYTNKNSLDDMADDILPAIQLNVKMLTSPNRNAVIFEHLILSLRPLSLYLEEKLLLRLADFFRIGTQTLDPAAIPDDESSDYEAQHIINKVLAANAKRYYFGDLSIVPSQIRLSVLTASKLSPHLSEIKKMMGLTLIKFEDAVINFDKFCDRHHFETMEVYLAAIKAHYKQELKWQAASILGSVDFLGNPLGFANDLSDGVVALIKDGNVKNLVKNVTHGISNSTAKLTETLSDGLGRVVLDERDTETRQRILEVSSSSTGDHLVAGLRGFGFGLLGGVTSIVKSTYNGAASDGIPGFLTGLGKGLVGTVTKPMIGVLDLASETANAVRETSKSSNRILPERKRIPRVVVAIGGLLPAFSSIQSKGQQHLFLINKRDFNEKFMSYEPCLLESKDSKLRMLVSTENIWVFSRTDETTTVIFSYNLGELITSTPVEINADSSSSIHSKSKTMYYIELCLSLPSKSLTPSAPEIVKRPRVRCENEETAKRASRNINYAKSVYDEREQAMSDSITDLNDR